MKTEGESREGGGVVGESSVGKGTGSGKMDATE